VGCFLLFAQLALGWEAGTWQHLANAELNGVVAPFSMCRPCPALIVFIFFERIEWQPTSPIGMRVCIQIGGRAQLLHVATVATKWFLAARVLLPAAAARLTAALSKPLPKAPIFGFRTVTFLFSSLQ
jgi:hypothetical protein